MEARVIPEEIAEGDVENENEEAKRSYECLRKCYAFVVAFRDHVQVLFSHAEKAEHNSRIDRIKDRLDVIEGRQGEIWNQIGEFQDLVFANLNPADDSQADSYQAQIVLQYDNITNDLAYCAQELQAVKLELTKGLQSNERYRQLCILRATAVSAPATVFASLSNAVSQLINGDYASVSVLAVANLGVLAAIAYTLWDEWKTVNATNERYITQKERIHSDKENNKRNTKLLQSNWGSNERERLNRVNSRLQRLEIQMQQRAIVGEVGVV